MSKKVKIGTNLSGNYVISLPGGYKVVPGKVTEIPEEILDNPGIKAYLKSGKLYLQEEVVVVVEAVTSAPVKEPVVEAPVEPVTAEAPKKKKKGKAEEVASEEVTAESVQADIQKVVEEVQAASNPETE